MSTHRTHPLEWVSLGFAVVALSYTEWSLAVAAGAHPFVAAAVPGALDVYAIRAMRVRRHVPVVVLAMVGVNALSYLVHAGVVGMSWPVLVLVSAIAPLVFWAVHVLGHGDAVPSAAEARLRAIRGVPQEAVLGDEHEHTEDAEESDDERAYEHDPGDHADTFDAHAMSAPGVSDYVPADWSSTLECEHGWTRTACLTCSGPQRAPGWSSGTRGLALPDMREARARRSTDPGHVPGDGHAVPEPTILHLALPVGYEHTEPSTADRDAAAIWQDWYEEHVREHGRAPALRTVKAACSVGTDRARVLLQIWSTQS